MTEEEKPKAKTGPKGPRLADDEKKKYAGTLYLSPALLEAAKARYGEGKAIPRAAAELIEKDLARHDRAEKRKKEKG